MATIFGQKKLLMQAKMIMTFMEVKGQQRSNIVNYVHGYQTWSEESMMQI